MLSQQQQQQQQQQQLEQLNTRRRSSSTSSSSSSSSSPSGQCGVCGWEPSCLQPMRRFGLLFTFLVVANLSSSALAAYHNAMVSTFEKRFNWKTRTVGFILSANDYGYLCTVLFTAHFGGMSHRPRLLAACSFLYGVTGVIYFLPYLLFGPKFSTDLVFGSAALLNSSGPSGSSGLPLCMTSAAGLNQSLPASTQSPNSILEDQLLRSERQFQSMVAFIIFMFAGVLQGVAVGPFWNVAFAMIDDMTKQWSGVFIGLYTLLRAVGPVMGYQIGAGTTKLNENLSGRISDFAGSQKSPLWIGAWWLGYLCTGVLAMMTSLPLFLFPRHVPLKAATDPNSLKNPVVRLLLMQSEKNEDILQQEESSPDARKVENSLAGLLNSIRRLASNKIFICLIIGNLFEFIALNTPVNYNAKYIEHHFDLTQSEASSVTGIVTPMGFGLGLGLSILVSFRFQMSMYSLARFHAFIHLFGIVRYISGMLFTCATPQVIMSAGNGSACGSCSSCSSSNYLPVCDGNFTYFSPCTAGCTDASLTTGCSCSSSGAVTRGTCDGACYSSMLAYAIVIVFLSSLQSSARTQEAVINLRCVQPRDKALSLAASSFLWGFVSSVLPPIIGSIFDSICVIRSSDAGNSYCEVYDRTKFRYAFHLLSVVSHSIACIFFFLVWYYCAARYGKDADAGRSVELPMDDAAAVDGVEEAEGEDEEEEADARLSVTRPLKSRAIE